MSEKQIELGALWAKKGPKGDYFTGTLTINGEKVSVVAFYNGNKKNEKEPDYRILKSIPRTQEETIPEGYEKIKPEDIPF